MPLLETVVLVTAAATSSIGSAIINCLWGILMVFNIYALYKFFTSKRTHTSDPDISAARKDRQYRDDMVSTHANSTALGLQDQARQVIERFTQQQTHFQTLIDQFDAAIKQTNIATEQRHTPRPTISISDLLDKMKAEYQKFCNHLKDITAQFSMTHRVLAQREKELSQIEQNLQGISLHLSTHAKKYEEHQTQMTPGLQSISMIDQALSQKNAKLEDQGKELRVLRASNEQYKSALETSTRENKQQKAMIGTLLAEINGEDKSTGRRRSSSTGLKMFSSTLQGQTSERNNKSLTV